MIRPDNAPERHPMCCLGRLWTPTVTEQCLAPAGAFVFSVVGTVSTPSLIWPASVERPSPVLRVGGPRPPLSVSKRRPNCGQGWTAYAESIRQVRARPANNCIRDAMHFAESNRYYRILALP